MPDETPVWEYVPGDYGLRHGSWWARLPNGGLVRLTWDSPGASWQVVEHDDGTVTVSPSLWQHEAPDAREWHGFLERGVWREA